MTLEGHTNSRPVGRVRPRRQVAGVDWVRTRSDPLGAPIRQASAHLEGRGRPRAASLLQPGRPLGRRRDAFPAAGRRAHVLGRATGKLKAQIDPGGGSYMFTPDGKKLIFAGESGWSPRKRRLLVWDIEQEKADADDRGRPLAVAAARVGIEPRRTAHRAGGMGLTRRRDKGKPVVVLWGMAADRPLYRLDQWADHLAFSPDGRTLLGVGRDGNAKVWDPRNGTLRETIRVCEAGHFAIRDIAVAPDGRHFAAAMGNGTARIFRLTPAPETVEPREPLPVVESPARPAKSTCGRN